MLIVTTKEASVYVIEYCDLEGNGDRLPVLRRTGPDDHDGHDSTGGTMAEHHWYRLSVLRPSPPRIAASMTLVLDPPTPGAKPLVRRTSTVLSVVGTL